MSCGMTDRRSEPDNIGDLMWKKKTEVNREQGVQVDYWEAPCLWGKGAGATYRISQCDGGLYFEASDDKVLSDKKKPMVWDRHSAALEWFRRYHEKMMEEDQPDGKICLRTEAMRAKEGWSAVKKEEEDKEINIIMGKYNALKKEQMDMLTDRPEIVYLEKDPKARHYDAGGIEVIEVIRSKLTPEQFRGYLLGNVIKYSGRLNFKGTPDRDAEKLAYYSKWLKGEFDTCKDTQDLTTPKKAGNPLNLEK